MASIYRSAPLEVPAAAAWNVLDRYTRSELRIFSPATAERQEGELRVVTIGDDEEVWERNVTVDPEHMRASYTIPGLRGAEHHHAEMRIEEDEAGGATLVWVTDFLPHELASALADAYDGLFDDLVAAVNWFGRRTGRSGRE